ncbi:DUF3558 domain-containing protein [Nocardia farcinica]|uniref:Protein of uncharacterized function (DUF3558) n=1 Tax=Nocardia farcinica TaxID=37329 RepID=A0A0H5P4V9_NOCFR|nr:DUF3558 domain-containing protein [Nocardia farcinica]AXK85704.1 DUF3558 domain-containing protein [Nocardia farcinica]MBF6254190.1 DUF3558 domain-containing protein [Nocardia farcinica]MBF6293682.1 DUF3558 domain-containing protein [Nocardia farcinica]MBF6375835.1 DUF3558 domain-containing protein [Nocardia farcinica]MBF6380538.1 DUF3558 domain-containing protein [Nocardia farcinica]
MRAVDAARGVIAGVAVLGLVTACSGGGLGGSEPGTPTAAEPAMDNLLDPCTDIADEWLIETGLDPSTERNIVNPADVSAWRICGWKPLDGRPYRIDVLSTSHTVDEVRADETHEILREITIGQRHGLLHKHKSDDRRICYVALPAQQGMFQISVGWQNPTVPNDYCEIAVDHATDLEPYLPK